jgi:hypothetical protein
MADDNRRVPSRGVGPQADSSQLPADPGGSEHQARFAAIDDHEAGSELTAPFRGVPVPGSQLALAVAAELAPYLDSEDD